MYGEQPAAQRGGHGDGVVIGVARDSFPEVSLYRPSLPVPGSGSARTIVGLVRVGHGGDRKGIRVVGYLGAMAWPDADGKHLTCIGVDGQRDGLPRLRGCFRD